MVSTGVCLGVSCSTTRSGTQANVNRASELSLAFSSSTWLLLSDREIWTTFKCRPIFSNIYHTERTVQLISKQNFKKFCLKKNLKDLVFFMDGIASQLSIGGQQFFRRVLEQSLYGILSLIITCIPSNLMSDIEIFTCNLEPLIVSGLVEIISASRVNISRLGNKAGSL